MVKQTAAEKIRSLAHGELLSSDNLANFSQNRKARKIIESLSPKEMSDLIRGYSISPLQCFYPHNREERKTAIWSFASGVSVCQGFPSLVLLSFADDYFNEAVEAAGKEMCCAAFVFGCSAEAVKPLRVLSDGFIFGARLLQKIVEKFGDTCRQEIFNQITKNKSRNYDSLRIYLNFYAAYSANGYIDEAEALKKVILEHPARKVANFAGQLAMCSEGVESIFDDIFEKIELQEKEKAEIFLSNIAIAENGKANEMIQKYVRTIECNREGCDIESIIKLFTHYNPHWQKNKQITEQLSPAIVLSLLNQELNQRQSIIGKYFDRAVFFEETYSKLLDTSSDFFARHRNDVLKVAAGCLSDGISLSKGCAKSLKKLVDVALNDADWSKEWNDEDCQWSKKEIAAAFAKIVAVLVQNGAHDLIKDVYGRVKNLDARDYLLEHIDRDLLIKTGKKARTDLLNNSLII